MYLKSEKSKDIYLGVIELGNKVVFSDPGYKELSWYNPVLSDVKSGLYRVYMNYDSEWEEKRGNEKDWQQKINSQIKNLDENLYLAIVDCHV